MCSHSLCHTLFCPLDYRPCVTVQEHAVPIKQHQRASLLMSDNAHACTRARKHPPPPNMSDLCCRLSKQRIPVCVACRRSKTKWMKISSAQIRLARDAAPAVAPAAAPVNFDWRRRPARWAARAITPYLGIHKKRPSYLCKSHQRGRWNTPRPFSVRSPNGRRDVKWI